MISRRIIRVKVMQSLYMFDKAVDKPSIAAATQQLQKSFNQSRALLLYLLYFITELSLYVETDARRRRNKHLPTADDLNVNTKLARNEVVIQLSQNIFIKEYIQKEHPENLLDRRLVQHLYKILITTEAYQAYVSEESHTDEHEILHFIFFNQLLVNEKFHDHIEDCFTNWEDDVEVMENLVSNFLKNPLKNSLSHIIGAEKLNFAQQLLSITIEKQAHLLTLINPKLDNWDADRIAVIDMIIMQMGLCEFLYFDTIPTTVTLNECIDIAKEYSTEQSGTFVNGILDSLRKDLETLGKIQKIDTRESYVKKQNLP